MRLTIHVSLRVSPQQTNWHSLPHKYVHLKRSFEGVREILFGCVWMYVQYICSDLFCKWYHPKILILNWNSTSGAWCFLFPINIVIVSLRKALYCMSWLLNNIFVKVIIL